MKWCRWFWILGLSQALIFSAQAQPGSQLDVYPLDEAVAAFRRIKPWINFCQTQAIRQQSKKIALGAAVASPMAVILSLITGTYVGEDIFASLFSSIWLLSHNAKKYTREQEKQIRTNNLDWISRISALPNDEREKISNELIAKADSYLQTFYALTPQEATELLRSNVVLRAFTLRLGEVHRILKKKKKLNLCLVDQWANGQRFQVPATP